MIKINNDLIRVKYNGEYLYFTSITHVARRFNKFDSIIKYALRTGKPFNHNGEKIPIKIVDGSEVKYKNINVGC